MLSYSELNTKHVIVLDGEPYEVLSTTGVVKKQRQKPHNTAKLRSLRSGSVTEKTFTQSDKIQEADLAARDIRFVYANRGTIVFADPANPADRFELNADIVGNALDYVREGDTVTAREFDGDIIGLSIPIKVDLAVVEAPPNIRGNTSAGGTKTVVLETGISVVTPLFIEAGDTIRVNTETGEYVERV